MADYTKLGQPYGPNMTRADSPYDPPPVINDWNYAGEQSTQTVVGAMETKPIGSGRSIDDLWIFSFIRSFNWKPSKQGFSIDGQTGNAEFSNIAARGNIIADGGFGGNIRTITASTTALKSDFTILCDCTTYALTVTLPSAADVPSQVFHIKKIDSSANAMTITPVGGQELDGSGGLSTNTQYYVLRIQSDGSNWYVV